MTLFAEISFVGSQQAWLARAAQEVSSIDRRDVLSPDFAGRTEQIARRYSFDNAPMLRPEGMRGQRRDVEREVDDYGVRRVIQIPVLDVLIPFVGDIQWFRFQPSSGALIDMPVEIRDGALVVSLRDASPEVQRAEIDRFVNMVTTNLHTLKQDVEGFNRQLGQTLDDVAKRRVEQIKAEVERDRRLGFPVT